MSAGWKQSAQASAPASNQTSALPASFVPPLNSLHTFCAHASLARLVQRLTQMGVCRQDPLILARKFADRWMVRALGVGLFKRQLRRREDPGRRPNFLHQLTLGTVSRQVCPHVLVSSVRQPIRLLDVP